MSTAQRVCRSGGQRDRQGKDARLDLTPRTAEPLSILSGERQGQADCVLHHPPLPLHVVAPQPWGLGALLTRHGPFSQERGLRVVKRGQRGPHHTKERSEPWGPSWTHVCTSAGRDWRGHWQNIPARALGHPHHLLRGPGMPTLQLVFIGTGRGGGDGSGPASRRRSGRRQREVWAGLPFASHPNPLTAFSAAPWTSLCVPPAGSCWL